MSTRTAEWTESTGFMRLIEALEHAGCRVEGSGRQRRAQCPHHPDDKPSLGVTDSLSRVLLICRAGCETIDILADLGLTWGDLFDSDSDDEARPRPDMWAPWQKRGHECAPARFFKYADEDGVLLYEHVRCGCASKEFAFRRPDPASRSGWRWSLGDVRRVLYRLPEFVRATGSGVFVTEGESDADALAAAGEVATTTDCGALTGKGAKMWRPEWSEALRGRDVLVCADRDEPGRVHARHVADSLEDVARFVWIVEAAEGKDVRDHLNAGLGVGDLVWWSLWGASGHRRSRSPVRTKPAPTPRRRAAWC